jgi:hypothetical protein
MVRTKTAPKKSAAKKSAKQSGKTTKAQSIRDTAKELGKKARPKDIIAALGAKGIVVTSPQVSITLKAAGLRKGKRKVRAGAVEKKASGNGSIHALNLNELIKVKALAAKFGGTEKLKEAVTALERLGIG